MIRLLPVILGIAAACIAVAVIFSLRARAKHRRVGEDAAAAKNVPIGGVADAIRAFLRSGAADGSALILQTDIVGTDSRRAASQVSIQQARVGVDHVLSVQANDACRDQFRELAQRRDLRVLELDINGERCLRVETSDAADFCCAVLGEIFVLRDDDEVELSYKLVT